MISSLYDKHNIGLFIVTILCVSFIQFSQLLIHLKKDILYAPIFNIIKNVGNYILVPESNFKVAPLLIMYLVSIIFLAGAFYISMKLIKKTYER